MKNLVHFETPWEQPDICDNSFAESNPGLSKLEAIRRVSNIAQALQNVMTQSEDNPDFTVMRTSIQSFLDLTQRKMMDLIHQSIH